MFRERSYNPGSSEILHQFPIKAVIFDYDGLLADTETLWWRTFQEITAPYGVILTEDDQKAC